MSARRGQVKASTQPASRAFVAETTPVSKLGIVVSTHTTETTLVCQPREVASDLVMGGFGRDWARYMSTRVCAVVAGAPIAERIMLDTVVSDVGTVVTANTRRVDNDQVTCWSSVDAPPRAFVGATQAAFAKVEEPCARHDLEMAKEESGA